MKKAKIIGTGNDGLFSYFIVEKNKDFFEWFAKLLKDSLNIYYPTYFEYSGEAGRLSSEREGKIRYKKKKLTDYVDKHERLGEKGEKIDVFYGDKRVFIVVRTSLKNRKKLFSVLNRISFW